MENHKLHIFHKKRKIDFEETFEVRIERRRPALSLLKPRWYMVAAEIDRSLRRRACPAFAKRPGAWAGPGVAPPARRARGPLRAGAVAVARLPSASPRVHENMTVLLLLHVQCTLRTRTRHKQIA